MCKYPHVMPMSVRHWQQHSVNKLGGREGEKRAWSPATIGTFIFVGLVGLVFFHTSIWLLGN